MKKILIGLLAVCLITPLMIQAAVTIPNPLKAANFEQLLNSIIDFLFYLSLGVVPLVIVIAGFYFITAEGDPQKVDTGKKLLKWAIIGFMIVLAAKGIIQLLQQIFLR
jgi:hypothetical protein